MPRLSPLLALALLAAACSAPAAVPGDASDLDSAADAALADTAVVDSADVAPAADVSPVTDVSATQDADADADTATKAEDAAADAMPDAASIGPAPGPTITPPADATWTIVGDCVQPDAAATPACLTVKCTKGNACMANGICTPTEPFIASNATTSQVAPALASRPDGAWALAWYDGTLDTEMHVYLQISLSGGAALSPPVQIDEPGAHFAFAPSVVALADGTWLVVWRDEQFFKGTVQFFGRRMATDGSFALGPQFEITNGPQWASGGSTNVVNPLAVRLRDGNVLVAWPASTQPGVLLSVHARRLDLNGNPLGPELDTGSGGPDTESYSPAIAPLPNGACLLAWQSWSNKGHIQVFGRRFDASGQPMGAVVPLSAGFKAYEALPAVAAFPDGGIFMSWKEGDVTTSTTPVAIAGKAWSPLLTPQTAGKYQGIGADPDGTYPDQGPATALPGERAAVVWHSAAAEGGIFLRRYYRAPDKLDCETTDVAGAPLPPWEGSRHLPAVETLADGRIVVAWDTLISGVPVVRVRILGW